MTDLIFFTLINKWGRGEHTIQHTALYLFFFACVIIFRLGNCTERCRDVGIIIHRSFSGLLLHASEKGSSVSLLMSQSFESGDGAEEDLKHAERSVLGTTPERDWIRD